MRIVHATEVFVGGMVSALMSLTNRQAEAGHEVTLVYPRKAAVPDNVELAARLSPAVELVELPYRGRRLPVVPALTRTLRELTAAADVDVVHVHSTYAGVAGRISPTLRTQVPVIAYSPHGFAFLRESSSRVSNRSVLAVERLLRNQCDGLVLVSESEAEVARTRLGAGRYHLLRNGIPVDDLPIGAGSGRARPVVVASGRLAPQKAPDRFAAIARALGDRADFVWIGDGTPEEREYWIGDAPVRVTGWLPHHELVAELAASDLFLFPTRWEGMPISLMEAQAIGLPAVATDVVGNRDVVVDGETGVLCGPDRLLDAVARLVDDPSERERMRARSIAVQRGRLSDSRLGPDSVALYERLAARRTVAVGSAWVG